MLTWAAFKNKPFSILPGSIILFALCVITIVTPRFCNITQGRYHFFTNSYHKSVNVCLCRIPVCRITYPIKSCMWHYHSSKLDIMLTMCWNAPLISRNINISNVGIWVTAFSFNLVELFIIHFVLENVTFKMSVVLLNKF